MAARRHGGFNPRADRAGLFDEHKEQSLKEQLERRLRDLKAEFESGQKMLAELEAKAANLRETLLRISGAIQVLEEELARANGRPPEAEGLDVGRVAAADEKAG